MIGIWQQLGTAIIAANPAILTLANANLDTGMADGAAPGTPPVFWTV